MSCRHQAAGTHCEGPAQPPPRMSVETRLLQASLLQHGATTTAATGAGWHPARSISGWSPARTACSSAGHCQVSWPRSCRENGNLGSASGWERHIPQGVISPTVERHSESDGKSHIWQMSTPEQAWSSSRQRRWAVVIYAGADCASEDRPQGCSPQQGPGRQASARGDGAA